MTRRLPRPEPIPPGPGQESAWDYPRPAICEPTPMKLTVVFAGRTIAESVRGFRVLETSHPPSYYLPPDDVAPGVLEQAEGRSYCEWKGFARYWSVRVGDEVAEAAAWSYPEPSPSFAAMRDYVSFYPQMMDACFVDGERVDPQQSGFYGGWATSHVVGPFKGPPGTELW